MDVHIDVVRTPDSRFESLPGYDFKPHYLEDLVGYEGLRLHYVDEGPPDGPIVLCLHGQPTWSYLYRKMIPVFLEAGHRVLAPDWFGFGRSDKPVEDSAYDWDFHHGTMTAFVDALGLERITLVCQDWGGLLGLTLPVSHPEVVSRLLVMNTALGIGRSAGEGFERWLAFVKANPDFDVVRLMKRTVPGLSDEEARAYGAPYPDMKFKAGVRRFPRLVPTSAEMPGAARSRKAATFWSTRWRGPTFMAVGALDPVLGPRTMAFLRSLIRGCPEPLLLPEAGHFVQERGDLVARAALAAFARDA